MTMSKKTYVCAGCGKKRKESEWETPVFNGFQKTDEVVKFFPESIKCDCGNKFYPEGLNPYNGQCIKKCGSATQPSQWEQIHNRPKGGF